MTAYGADLDNPVALAKADRIATSPGNRWVPSSLPSRHGRSGTLSGRPGFPFKALAKASLCRAREILCHFALDEDPLADRTRTK